VATGLTVSEPQSKDGALPGAKRQHATTPPLPSPPTSSRGEYVVMKPSKPAPQEPPKVLTQAQVKPPQLRIKPGGKNLLPFIVTGSKQKGPTEAELKIEELTRQLEEEMERQEEEGEYFGMYFMIFL
jgi:LIM domain-containing protein